MYATTVYFKLEFEQVMRSIQTRGVVYTLLQLSDEQRRKGVIAISTGHHFAYILCHFGMKFKIPVTVVMLSSAARGMVEKCRELLATVIQCDNMIQAHEFALRNARKNGLLYIDGYSFLTS